MIANVIADTIGVDAATMAVAATIEKSAYSQACVMCAARGANTFENDAFQCAYNHLLFNLRHKLDAESRRPNVSLRRIIKQCIIAHRYIRPPVLRDCVLECIFPLHAIAAMRPEQLNPELYADRLTELGIRQNVKYEIVYATHYLCTCGARKTIVNSVQLRSADEGKTDMIHCVACNRRWKKTG